MKAILSSAAERDVRRALDYFINRAGATVAENFIDQLELKLEKIKINPEAYRVIAKSLRSANLDRFPYQIIFRIVNKDLIRVISVRHHKQHPDFGLSR